jgi:hypothetical protein
MIRSIATIFGVGFASLLVWAGSTYALSWFVPMSLAAGLPLGIGVLLLGLVLARRLSRRFVEQLERSATEKRDEPKGLPVRPPGVAAAPVRDLP